MKKVAIIPKRKHKFDFISFSFLSIVVLIIGAWAFIYIVDGVDLSAIFTEKNLLYTKKFLRGLIGIGEENPAFKSVDSIKNSLRLTYETLQMGVMAIGFTAIGMFITVIPASRNVADGTLTPSKGWYSIIVFGLLRCIYVFSRAVPELVWAMILVFIFKPGILPGALALALHNFGVLGKLCAEVVENLDTRPVRNLASCGASKSQILFYSVLPAAMPKFLTYIFYRGEVILRASIVVGFVGAGGLGQQFKLSMSYFKYTEVTLIILCYLLLVILADLISEGSRIVSK